MAYILSQVKCEAAAAYWYFWRVELLPRISKARPCAYYRSQVQAMYGGSRPQFSHLVGSEVDMNGSASEQTACELQRRRKRKRSRGLRRGLIDVSQGFSSEESICDGTGSLTSSTSFSAE